MKNFHFIIIWSVAVMTVSCKQNQTAAGLVDKAEESLNYSNPVIAGDFADPSVIRVGDMFYAVGTSSEWAPHFPVFTSKDLVNWEQQSYALPETPEWASSSFWAPELFYYNNTFYLYYVAKRKSDGISCIGVATSKDPSQGFKDQGVLLSYGNEAIDPFIIEDKDQLYLSWKAYGLADRPIEILASKLSNDGLEVVDEPFSLLTDENSRGIEGQYVIKKDEFHYLFYSEGACCGRNCDYDIRVARAESFSGPYQTYDGNPILKENKEWKCPGHGTMVQAEDGRWFYMYHAYSQKNNVYTGRQALLDEIIWNKDSGWPEFKSADAPSAVADLSEQAEKQKTDNSFQDDFNSSSLSSVWQWDFRNAEPEVKLEEGNLILSGNTKEDNKAGTVLTVRPAFGNYECSTEVINQNSSYKGLVLYGDANQAVFFGLEAGKLQLVEIKDNVKTVLAEEAITSEAALNIKMSVEDGYKCRFFWSLTEDQWQEIQGTTSFYDGNYLPQWDRSARPGLFHYGSKEEPAKFSFFTISYNNKEL